MRGVSTIWRPTCRERIESSVVFVKKNSLDSRIEEIKDPREREALFLCSDPLDKY